jgi:AhpD family alkylhydroperoxidase
MTTFDVHSTDTAPEASRPHLEKAAAAFGSIPNLFGVFAESPALLEAYLDVGRILEESSSFDATELQVVLLATSFDNGCDYCMAAHSGIAAAHKVPQDVVRSLREGTPIADAKLEALRVFTRAVVQRRGWVPDEEVRAFLDAGYTRRHLLDVILGVGFKTLSNYANHIANTPLDRQFQRLAWSRPDAVAAE